MAVVAVVLSKLLSLEASAFLHVLYIYLKKYFLILFLVWSSKSNLQIQLRGYLLRILFKEKNNTIMLITNLNFTKSEIVVFRKN